MKYLKDYSKLFVDEYTTIRRYPKGKVGKVVSEKYPSGQHFSKIMRIERKPFDQIPTKLLLKDTDCETRSEAFNLLQSFYNKPINEYTEKLYIYYLKKTGRKK